MRKIHTNDDYKTSSEELIVLENQFLDLIGVKDETTRSRCRYLLNHIMSTTILKHHSVISELKESVPYE